MNTVAFLFWLSAALSIYGAEPPQRAGADFCAIVLKLESREGPLLGSTLVELINSKGETVHKQFVGGADYRICDFGLGSHSLVIGANECHPVTIGNLTLRLGYPMFFRVVLPDCEFGDQIRSACLAFVRVTDFAGSPIPNVTFSVEGSQPLWTRKTDSRGRWQDLWRGESDFIFSQVGFQATRVHVSCKSTEELSIAVVLSRDSR